MSDIFDKISAAGAHRVMLLNDQASGLRAIIALDELTLGPACGGIRTQPYATFGDALADVARLSAAMTLKCAIAGVDAGGGKTVVIDHPQMDRAAAFRRLGRYINDLGGLYRAAGDLGTSLEDLLHAAEETDYVDTTGAQLGEATGIGIVNCIRACALYRDIRDLGSLTIAVQGCGLIGAGVARSMAQQGATVVVADVDPARAAQLASEIGGTSIGADQILMTDADIVAPCAVGGILTEEVVAGMKAWAICGGANNQLASPVVGTLLAERGIAYVPDFLASAGAVIDGATRSLMHIDRAPLLAQMEGTALAILATARDQQRPTTDVARDMAVARIAAAKG
jgi:leucine dehydrogenase